MFTSEGYYLPPVGATDFLILDTSHPVQTFLTRTDGLPVEKERWIGHYVDDIVAYMSDHDEWESYLNEYFLEHAVLLQERHPPELAWSFVNALRELASGIHGQLEQAHAWDSEGVLPYSFDNLIGSDIVLRRVDMQQDGPPCKDG